MIKKAGLNYVSRTMASATSNTVVYQLTLESSGEGYREKLRSTLKRNKYVKEKLRKLHFAAQVGMLPLLRAPRAPGERQPAHRTVSSAVMGLTPHIALIPPGSTVPSQPVIHRGGTPLGVVSRPPSGTVILSWYRRDTGLTLPGTTL